MADVVNPKHKKLEGQARVIEETRRAIIEFGKAVTKDRMLLLTIVTGGRSHWRKTAGKAFRGFMVDRQLLDQMFEAMVEQAGEDPKAQFEALQKAGLDALKMERIKGLAQFITSPQHAEEVLERCVPNEDERAAIRLQLLRFVNADTRPH